MDIEEFPFESLIKIESEDDFVGRIIIDRIKDRFNAEIAIVNLETHKIFHHVANLYGLSDAKETLDLSVQKLSEFLMQKESF